MSLLWADGFDDYDYDAAASTGAVAGEYETYSDSGSGATNDITVDVVGRRGSGALKIGGTSSGSYAQKSLAAALTEIYVAMAVSPAASVATTLFSFFSGATCQVSVLTTAAGALEVRRGTATGTVIGTSASGLIPTGAFTQIQMRLTISDTTGVVQIRLNGSTSYALNLSAQDTNNGAAAVSVDSVRLGYTGASAMTTVTTYDDFVIWDTTGSVMNTWVGDVRVDSYAPNGEGDTQNFTTSTGSTHYTLVDEASPDATDYVQSATLNDKELFAFADMTHTPTNIYGVVPTVAALKDDAGNRSIKLLAKSGGTEALSASDIALSTTRTRCIGVMETDPNTAAAWTKTAFNAAQFGVKVTV